MMLLDAGGGHIMSLAFTPDCATLFAAHYVTGIRAWNLSDRTFAPYKIPDTQPNHGRFVFIDGGRWAYGSTNWDPHLWVERGGPTYLLLDLATGANYPLNVSLKIGCAAVTPDCARVVALEDFSANKEWPSQSSASLYRLCCRELTGSGLQYRWHREYPNHVDGGLLVATIGPERCVEYEIGGSTSVRPGRRLRVCHTSDGEVERVIELADHWFSQLITSPDATKLVARCGTELTVWDTTDWDKPPVTVKGVQKSTMEEPAACFHPSGQYLLLANGGPSVLVFETATWKQVRKWKWDAGGVLRVVAVAPDGALAAAGGTRGTVVVWDLDL